jgi:L-ascorbate metabolism protein UlaG (beta-lactamase superfamily)
MKMRWYGTATVNIIHDGGSILFDPFIARNPRLDCGMAEELAGLGDIFITHGHLDHASDVPLISGMGNRRVFCSQETAKILSTEGVANKLIVVVKPGDVIKSEPFTIKVLASQHCQSDPILIIKTLTSPRMMKHYNVVLPMLKEHLKFKMGNVLAYQIEAEGKTILHLGSLNLSNEEIYPEKVDVLTIPFQGRADLSVYALQFVQRIKPKALFLHHFDDTFPPVSNHIDCQGFVKSIQNLFPDMNIIIPVYRKPYSV